ncbi:MAG: polysaccharide deacetylase [Gammaproteobacteria bacterium]
MKVKVFFTVDVEIWCHGWHDLDRAFPQAFERYIYGPTRNGHFGLTRTLERLNAYGLQGVFFTEPLFSARFGVAALQEIVGLIQSANQEVQLHLHTEWADEAIPPLIASVTEKRQHLWMFSLAEQKQLIETGISLMQCAGAGSLKAFRAGSFAMNHDTWLALEQLGIPFDASFNATMTPLSGPLRDYHDMTHPRQIGAITEYPISAFRDGLNQVRHAQLGACSYRELEWLLWTAVAEHWDSVVILSHNFELMNQAKTRADSIVDQRFEKLCRFLALNSDHFQTCGFQNLEGNPNLEQRLLPRTHWSLTAERASQQLLRRIFG